MVLQNSPYGLLPSKGGNVVFAVLFGLLFFAHTGFAIKYRQRWIGFTFFVGLGLEFVGYIARAVSSNNPYDMSPYMAEMVCLTIAPVFIMAGYYYLLAQFAAIYGPAASLFTPIYYSYIFIVCDIFSLLLQAAGGGVASSATKQNKSALPGTHIMLGGLAFQVLTMTIFLALWILFFYQVYVGTDKKAQFDKKDKHSFFDTSYKDHIFSPAYAHIRERKSFQFFPMIVSIGTVAIYIRCIYRVIELAEGWRGYLILHEVYLFVLDGLMILIAALVVALVYPGRVFGKGNLVSVPKALNAKNERFERKPTTEMKDKEQNLDSSHSNDKT